jgi:cytochrome c-type biogenesis protein CcmH/NrfG
MTAMAIERIAASIVTGLLLFVQPGDAARAQQAARQAADRADGAGVTATVEALVRETSLCPRDAGAWRRLGAAYEAAGMRLLAIRSYRRALRLDPRDARAAGRLRALDRVSPSDGTRWAD